MGKKILSSQICTSKLGRVRAHLHAQTQCSKPLMHTSHKRKHRISILFNSFLIYTGSYLYLNRWYSIMLQMGTIVTGLEKSSYKSFALEADLSVWLVGRTERRGGHAHGANLHLQFLTLKCGLLLYFRQTGFWHVAKFSKRDKTSEPPQPPNNKPTLANTTVKQIRKQIICLLCSLTVWRFNWV